MISLIQSEADDIVLNAEEAGKILKVSASAMYKKAKRNQVPHHKLGGRLYFLRNELIGTVRNS